jgi:hypothetical protein
LKFKNDKERIAFLEDYRNEEHGWYLWREIDAPQKRWWRFDLGSCALIVEEQPQTFTWPEKHVSWRVACWYIISDWHGFFADQVASRSLALAALKKEERDGRSD